MCALVFVPPLPIGKLRNEGVFYHQCAKANAGKTLSWQFTKVWCIHRGFYKLKTMDDDHFQHAFANR
jgi:hypothetical protein